MAPPISQLRMAEGPAKAAAVKAAKSHPDPITEVVELKSIPTGPTSRRRPSASRSGEMAAVTVRNLTEVRSNRGSHR